MTEPHDGHLALIAEFPALEGVEPDSPEWFEVWEREARAEDPGNLRYFADIRSRAQQALEKQA